MKKMQPLHQAIVRNDLCRMRELLDAGADIQALTANGRNALQLAEFAHNLPALVMLAGAEALTLASDDIWCTALKRKEFGIDDIPAHRLNDVLCDALLLSDPDCYSRLPASYREAENLSQRCLLAPSLMAHIPQEIQQQAAFYQPLMSDLLRGLPLGAWRRPWPDHFIEDALAHTPKNFTELSESEKTYARSLWLVKQNGNYLDWVPDAHRDRALCLEAMKTGYCLEAVPGKYLDRELIQAAASTLNATLQNGRQYSADPSALPSVSAKTLAILPEHMRSYAICLAAVARDYEALKLVPEQFKTLELCCSALEGREWLGMQLNEIFALIPESLHDQVQAQANFQHHIQPGEFEDWETEIVGIEDDWGWISNE